LKATDLLMAVIKLKVTISNSQSFDTADLLLMVLVRAMATATLAAITTLSQKRGRENEQAILHIIVEPFF
jgi:hypothetical protein